MVCLDFRRTQVARLRNLPEMPDARGGQAARVAAHVLPHFQAQTEISADGRHVVFESFTTRSDVRHLPHLTQPGVATTPRTRAPSTLPSRPPCSSMSQRALLTALALNRSLVLLVP